MPVSRAFLSQLVDSVRQAWAIIREPYLGFHPSSVASFRLGSLGMWHDSASEY